MNTSGGIISAVYGSLVVLKFDYADPKIDVMAVPFSPESLILVPESQSSTTEE